ncbi:short-chain dehydrogenase [Pedobacter steynii]|uniref:Short-chain dehydrogenase n=1 Tax=Pedobacter steynii TaxID=430522 RepID=A0A1D7QMU3_9SPHI|nr:short-chain dehydrogenase [Pedobacter steynii]AOM79981.1 short-chain dehydrogenase [Pedobacter steynii]
MKKYLCLFMIGLQWSCSSEQTDQILLEKDRVELAKSLTSDKIIVWKFGKIGLRAAGVQDTTMPEYQKHSRELQSVSRSLSGIDPKKKELSITEMVLLYRDYRNIKSFVVETDEDIFPPLMDGINAVYAEPVEKQNLVKQAVKRSEADKIFLQNMEHAILSMLVLATRDLGVEISLYECSKTQPDKLPDSEMKTLLQFVRGFLFFSNRFYYLSEDEMGSNIKWLEKNKGIDLPYTRAFFNWGKLNNEQTNVAFHSLNHLFRGFDRLMMKRDIDEERALDDFEAFLADAHKLGLQTELVWSIESYVAIKRRRNDQAIAALTKLKASPLLSDSEKKSIEESIGYLKERDPDAKLNGIYDKVFISKIGTRYMMATLAKIDWRKLMKENKVSHTDEIFATIDRFKTLSAEMEKMTSQKNITDQGKGLKEKGNQLLDKVSDFLK